METVLITGITGYVGSHLGKQLLEGYSDKFKLRVVVRNVKKLEPLKKAYGDDLFAQLDVRVADLLNKEALAASVEGCQYIVHLANPVVGTQFQDEEEMVRPAREGMQTLLEAAEKYKVRKLIVTSSMINMIGNVWKRATGDHHYTEMDYAPYYESDTYTKSKLAQEA